MRLSTAGLLRAANLWNNGRGSHEIAMALEVPEAAVANSLDDIRAIARRLRPSTDNAISEATDDPHST